MADNLSKRNDTHLWTVAPVPCMDLDLSDLTILVYNWGVVLSGGYIAITFGLTSTELLPVSFVLAFFWTIYYRTSMEDKLPPFDDEDEIDERKLPTRDEQPVDDGEPPEQSGPDAPWE